MIDILHHRFGHYPAAIMADQIYRNRENRQFCKAKGIRLSGPALGRPSKDKAKLHDQRAAQDAAELNAIEAKFGEGKRHYGMGLISTRLQATSETVISLQLLVMNLERSLWLRFVIFLHSFLAYHLKNYGLFENRFSSPYVESTISIGRRLSCYETHLRNKFVQQLGHIAE